MQHYNVSYHLRDEVSVAVRVPHAIGWSYEYKTGVITDIYENPKTGFVELTVGIGKVNDGGEYEEGVDVILPVVSQPRFANDPIGVDFSRAELRDVIDALTSAISSLNGSKGQESLEITFCKRNDLLTTRARLSGILADNS